MTRLLHLKSYCKKTILFQDSNKSVKKDGFKTSLMGRGTIHHENMQALATEMFKVFTGISPKIITNHGNEL